jgi:orotidine-5'-phosphate decarboxylase
MTFFKKLQNIQQKNNSLVCVGLDSDFEQIPVKFRQEKEPQFSFNKWIIEQTYEYVCAYKPNSAFYESRGVDGISELKQTIDYIHSKHPEIPVVLDAKRADIGNTSTHYAKYAFDYLQADAITVSPYLGKDSLDSILAYKDKGIFILCKTSNPSAGEIQDQLVRVPKELQLRHPELTSGSSKIPLYQLIALKTIHEWNYNRNCALVVGATYPDELRAVREIVGDMTILVPGVGSQGGDLEKTLDTGLTADGKGLIINSSRSIIFSEDPKREVKSLTHHFFT